MAQVEPRRPVLEQHDEILSRLRAEVRPTSGNTRAVEELIADRRTEAQCEAEEHERHG